MLKDRAERNKYYRNLGEEFPYGIQYSHDYRDKYIRHRYRPENAPSNEFLIKQQIKAEPHETNASHSFDSLRSINTKRRISYGDSETEEASAG